MRRRERGCERVKRGGGVYVRVERRERGCEGVKGRGCKVAGDSFERRKKGGGEIIHEKEIFLDFCIM